MLIGAGVLSVFEGPHEAANCEKAISLFENGVAKTAAEERIITFIGRIS